MEAKMTGSKYSLSKLILVSLSFVLFSSCSEEGLKNRCFKFESGSIREELCFISEDSAVYNIYWEEELIFKSVSSYYYNQNVEAVSVDREFLNDKAKLLLMENEYSCVGRVLGKVENLNSWFFNAYIYRHNKIEVNCSLEEF